MNLVIAATFICGACVLSSCKTAHTATAKAAPKVVSTELIRTSQSWDGVELPDYFQGRPELVAVKYVFPAGQKLGWHHHVAMNYGVLVQGELTIIGLDGKTKVVHEGEVVVGRGGQLCIAALLFELVEQFDPGVFAVVDEHEELRAVGQGA